MTWHETFPEIYKLSVLQKTSLTHLICLWHANPPPLLPRHLPLPGKNHLDWIKCLLSEDVLRQGINVFWSNLIYNQIHQVSAKCITFFVLFYLDTIFQLFVGTFNPLKCMRVPDWICFTWYLSALRTDFNFQHHHSTIRILSDNSDEVTQSLVKHVFSLWMQH